MSTCPGCDADLGFLTSIERRDYEALPHRIRLVDLFSGGGGFSLGVAEAAWRLDRGTDVVLAVEQDEAAADMYALNFPKANLLRSDVTTLFDGLIGRKLTASERRLRDELGRVDILVAGPPCQGHSDLNNWTRRTDPKNALYLRAARAAEVLSPTFVLIENVPAVQHDTGNVLDNTTKALEKAGYAVAASVLDLVKFGVPQRRRRHILLAVRGRLVEPDIVLETASPCQYHPGRTVAWAIRDLVTIASTAGPDSPSRASEDNRDRMAWLLAKDDRFDLPNSRRPKCHRGTHSYVSMYGRLKWDAPAQTITTGFGSMGQGRFVHPALPRTLTPHEAARLQTLPDFFQLDETKGRGAWAAAIGNAVPPLLGVYVIEPLLCALVEADSASEPPLDPVTQVHRIGRRNGTPPASSEEIRQRMTRTKQRDTKPEMALRSALHTRGLRYWVDRPVNGTRRRVDIAFPTDRLAIFVDGCFWHGCPLHGTVPKQNRDWWVAKLDGNKKRDSDTDQQLRASGWEVLRFWEHDDSLKAAAQVEEVLVARRKNRRICPDDWWPWSDCRRPRSE